MLIYGSWAERYHGVAGPPPHDVDVLVVGSPARTDVYAASDRAQERLGLPVNPVIRWPEQWRDPRDPLSSQMRRRRNELEYPAVPGDSTTEVEVIDAAQDVQPLLSAASRLLTYLSIFL